MPRTWEQYFFVGLLALPTKAKKDIVFRFIIEYSSLIKFQLVLKLEISYRVVIP